MKKIYTNCFFILLLFLVIDVRAQVNTTDAGNPLFLKGIIIDEASRAPLPYVSIGILDKPVGTLTDSTGHFSFSIEPYNLLDTVQVSLIGYATKRIAVSELLKEKSLLITLQVHYVSMEEVVVTNKPTQEEIIGRQKSGKLLQVSMHNKKSAAETIGSEMGIRVTTKNPKPYLKDLNWFLSANNFKSIKLRVNIYSVKDNYPEALIYPKQLLFDIKEFQTGWIRFDLEPYDIQVPNDFIITLQWIDGKQEKEERPITFVPVGKTFSGGSYVRIASQDKWKKVGMVPSCYVTLSY